MGKRLFPRGSGTSVSGLGMAIKASHTRGTGRRKPSRPARSVRHFMLVLYRSRNGSVLLRCRHVREARPGLFGAVPTFVTAPTGGGVLGGAGLTAPVQVADCPF